MLESIDLSLALTKKAYKPVQKKQIEHIFDLAELIYERKRPVVVVFEGWDAAGKGTTIRALTAELDARGYKVLPTQAARTHEKQKPWLWRFWMNIPRYGQIAIFDRSWYGRVLIERVEGLTSVPEWIASYEEINDFERTLAADGTVFIKFWLHISREEQLRRFIELSSDPSTAWQVTAEDRDRHLKYDEYLAAVRDMLTNTDTAYAPWTIVPSTDRDYRLYYVFDTIIRRLEAALGLEATQWPTAKQLQAKGSTKKKEKGGKEEKKKAKAAKAKPTGDGKSRAKSESKQKQTPSTMAEDGEKPARNKRAKQKAKDGADAAPPVGHNSSDASGEESLAAVEPTVGTQPAAPEATPGKTPRTAKKPAPRRKPARAQRRNTHDDGG